MATSKTAALRPFTDTAKFPAAQTPPPSAPDQAKVICFVVEPPGSGALFQAITCSGGICWIQRTAMRPWCV
jgi:hypothetical protein